MTSSHLIWYAARAGGLISWALLSAAVVWGLALSTGSVRRWAKPAWLLDLHRFLGGLALIFVAIHIGAILADTYVHFGLVQILVPFTSTWHPVAVTWGVLSAYLLVAVELTSLFRSRLPRQIWRRVHYATVPLFAVATLHGFTAGTDRSSMAFLFTGVTAVIVVGVFLGRRLSQAAQAEPVRPRLPAGTTREQRDLVRAGSTSTSKELP